MVNSPFLVGIFTVLFLKQFRSGNQQTKKAAVSGQNSNQKIFGIKAFKEINSDCFFQNLFYESHNVYWHLVRCCDFRTEFGFSQV